MTELAVRVVLKADGSGLVGQLKLAAAELQAFKTGAADAGTGTAALATGAADAADGVDAVAAAAGAAGTALADAAGKAGQVGGALEETAGKAAAATTALAGHAKATTDVGTAADVLARAETALVETLAAGTTAGAGQIEVLKEIGEKATTTADALGSVDASTPSSTGTLDGIASALGDVAGAAIGAGAAVEKAGDGSVHLDGLAQAASGVGDALGDAGASGAAALTEMAMGKLGGVIGLVGGAVGGLAGEVAGALIGALTDAVIGLFDTSEKTKLAASGMDALAQRNASTGTFVDQLTGKLIEQNRTLLQNALLSRQTAIRANSTAILAKRDAAFDAARAVTTNGGPVVVNSAGAPIGSRIIDPDVDRAIRAAGNNIVLLARNLQELAARRPELAELSRKVNDLASTAILARRNSGDLRREVTDLAIALKGGTVSTTSLIERQVAYANATGRVERAQLRLRDVRATAARADQKGGAALVAYRRDLNAATAELAAAQAAERRVAPARAGHAAATRAAAAATRDLGSAQRELGLTLEALERQFDPAAATARRYAETMADIARLHDAGTIDQTTAFRYGWRAEAARDEATAAEALKDLSPELREAMARPLTDSITTDFSDLLTGAATRGGAAFGRSATASIDSVGRALELVVGGAAGRSIGGLFQAAAGRGGVFGQSARGGGSDFTAGLADVFAPVRDVLGRLSDRVEGSFGDQGSLTRMLGRMAGYAAIGGVAGAVVGGSALGGSAGGAIGGKFAEKFLSTGLDTIVKGAGQFAGPIGSVVGGVLGSAIGGLLKSTPKASATVTSVDGDAMVAGSKSLTGAVSGLATSVQGGISRIAEQLGGTLGSFSVSIGQRKDSFRVDPTGAGRTKAKGGVVDFGDDEAAAIAFAIRDAIADGAVTGLSAAVQQAIGSNADLDKALAEALQVQALETLIGGVQSAIASEFGTFEATARERVRIAGKYGLDLVKVEAANGKARADLFDKVLKDRVAGLQSFLDDLSFGSLFEGSAADRRGALLSEFGSAKADADAGVEGAAEKLAGISRQLLDVSKSAYGTAGGEYAGDLATARTAAENVIALENARVKAAADEARGLRAAAEAGNTLANEANDLLAQNNVLLTALPDAIARLLPAAPIGPAYSTARVPV